MDLHRLRVVGFDTSIREKEHEKKNNVQLEEYKKEKEVRKTSTIGNRDQVGDENQSLYEKSRPAELPKKYSEKISQQEASKNYLDDTPDVPGTLIKMDVNDEVTLPRASKQCPSGKLGQSGFSKKHLNNTTPTSHLGLSKIQRSKSEIFKTPPKKKPRKRALKISSSDIGLIKLFQNSAYSHQKKRTINLPKRNRKEKKHQKEENVKEKIETIQFLFARETPSFIRYRRKRTGYERKKKTHDTKLTNDIFGFQKSNRKIVQSQISFLNFIDTDKLPFKKMRIRRKTKPPTPVTNCYCKHHAMRVLNSSCGNVGTRPIYYNLGTHPHPRRYHQKRDCYQAGFKRERSYSMVKDKTVEVSPSLFSPVRKSLRDTGTGPSKVELHADSCHRPPRVLEKSTTIQNFTVANEHNQKPSPLPSTPSPCAAYTALSQSPYCELKKSQTFQDVTCVSEGDEKPSPETSAPTPCALCAARTVPAKRKCKKKRKNKRKKTKKTFFPLTLFNEYFSRFVKRVTNFHLDKKNTCKNCIKYVFFGLLIVVWSPCLLAIILAWVVMFPWKLTNILKTDVSKRSFPINQSFKNRLRKNNLRREYQRMCFENYMPEKKKSCMTLAASFFTRTVGIVVKSFNAVVSLLKFKRNVPMEADSSFLASSHPNPRKRYKLFYANNRGWVLKPLRRRTRSYASNRVLRNMRCEYDRPTFWQNSRGQNLKMIPLKKVRHPVHVACRNLRHHWSPAGDAYPVQSKGSWPGCVCEGEYPEPPYVPLKSQRHQQQQVNIPSIYFYPTSGIAFNSTDEKGIINRKKLNSNEIENNVFHKDIAKDYRGLRKNGTLPVELVFNNPCKVKLPLTTNLETCRTHKLGLSDKTLNMSTKCTSSLLPKYLKGQLPNYWTKHNVENALLKAQGVHRMTSFRYNTNSMPTCKLNKLQTTKVLNCPYTRNQNLAIMNKNSRNHQENINLCNKSVLTDTLLGSALAKQENTSTYKASYGHNTQNTSKHIRPCQKVGNKSKTEKTKPDMASKCAYDAKRFPAKQEFRHKPKNHITTQKYPSTAKIKSSMKHNKNYSFENKRKQTKQNYKCRPDRIAVATQMLLNTADITTMTNRDIILNCSCGENYAEFKHCHEHKPHQMFMASQKQLCTADITTSTNRNVALDCPGKENHGLYKHDYKHKPNKIPVATQIKSRTADNTTTTYRNLALNCPCAQKYKLTKYGYTHRTLVATHMQSRIAENTTDTNQKLPLNCSCKEKFKLSQPKHKPHNISVATQMQSRTAENATGTYWDALNDPVGVKQSIANKELLCIASTADKESKYIQDISLSQSIYIPGQIPVAIQKQSNIVDITTMTNLDTARNCSYKHKQSEDEYKYKPDHILAATQQQPSTVDITSTKYLGGIITSRPHKDILHARIPSTAGKDSARTQNSAPKYISKTQDKYIQKQSYKIDTSVNCVSDYEKNENKEIIHPDPNLSLNKTVFNTDATTCWEKTAPKTQITSFEKVIDGAWEDKRNKREIDTERPKRGLVKKMIDCSCRTIPKPIAIAAGFPIERQAEENIFTQCPMEKPPRLKSCFVGGKLEVRRVSTTQPLSTRQVQMEDKQFQRHANIPLFGLASQCHYCLAPQATEASNLQVDSCRQIPQQNKRDKKMKQKVNNSKKTYTKTNSIKESPNKPIKLSQAPSHTVQKESKLFVTASDSICGKNQEVVTKKSLDKNILIKRLKVPKESRQHGSGTTTLANTQKLTSEPGIAHPLKTRIVIKSLPTLSDIQGNPCACKWNTAPLVKPKFPENLPRTQPEIPKIDKTLAKFPKISEYMPSQMLQENSSQFRIASHSCYGSETPQRNESELKQRRDYSKNIYTHKSSSAEDPPSKQSNIIKKPACTLQKQSWSLRIASDYTCGTNPPTVSEKSLYKKVSSSKSIAAKEIKSKSLQHLPLLKSLPRTHRCRSLPRKCRSKSLSSKCRCPIESVQTVDVQYYRSKGSLISSEINIDNRSQFPKSSERTRSSKSLPRRYRCLESPQDFEDKPSHSAKFSTLTSKRNVVKVDKTPSNLQKSSDHAETPPPKYFRHDCACLVKSLKKGLESKNISERSRKSFYSRKPKRNSTDTDFPCTSSQRDCNKVSFISDVPINWQTKKQSIIRSSRRTENTCSVNEPPSRIQSSRISQYSSKVISLVMNLRSKLFSLKSKQTKISKQPTKKTSSVNLSSLQVKPKKVDRRNISINDILESILDVESNQRLFRKSHKSKTSQNRSPPLLLHSNYSSCSSVIHKRPLRQCTKKNRYIRKPTVVNKSFECVHYKARTFQRPSFLSHTSKYECSTKVDPRISQSIISQQTKTSKCSSIVTLFKRKPLSKLQSAPIKTSQKFDPQYSSFLMNCQQTPTARQAMVQELLDILKLKLESKPLAEKIGSISDKISTNSQKQVNKSSTSTDKVKKQFDTIPQQPKVKQGIQIIPGNSCQQTAIPLNTPLYNSQSLCKKPYKYRSFKHDHELKVPNSLHKIANKRISHETTNKFEKSHLISHMCNCSATAKRLREHIMVQKSDIPRNAGIQSNLQFQMYQQNLPDQKRLIQSSKIVDKPSRKSLQQHSDAPGYAQKTAEGKARQLYPDFNRVVMRYPALNKTSLDQSLQVPGLNSPSPANNYPPAPGDTPPPNYASDPYYPIPPCEQKLRRVYKRQPLRYTSPRHQVPRSIMIRKLKEKRERCAEAKSKKEKEQKQSFFQCLRKMVNKTEREVWPTEVKCSNKWLSALKTKPCFCVYKVCPRMHQAVTKKSSRSVGRMFVYFLTLCFWSPLLYCAYLCCNVLCKCCG